MKAEAATQQPHAALIRRWWKHCLALVFVFACAAPEAGIERNHPSIPLFPGYPLPLESLQPARPFIVKGDGQGLFHLANQNERALKQRLQAEASAVRPLLCDGCGPECRRASLNRMKEQTDRRNRAVMKQLRLRLDALEARLQQQSSLSEFRRNRLLLETVAEERLLHIQSYWLQAIAACQSSPVPEGRWFLPYYTAYFKLARALPDDLRSSDFFP